MAFVNGPNRYTPIGSHEERVWSSGFLRDSMEQEGLFFAAGSHQMLAESEAYFANPHSATLQAYQYWVEAGWKTKHGTYAAANRFGEKAYEEHSELYYAYEALHSAPLSEQASGQKAITSELGDNLWTMVALATNASADIDQGMKNKLYEYTMGINHIVDGTPTAPPWRNAAAELATKYHPLTFSDITRLIAAGFEPTPSAAMNIFEPESDDGDIHEHIRMLFMIIAAMRNTSEAQYAYGGDLDTQDRPVYVMPEQYDKASALVGRLCAQGILEIAFIANRAIKQGLEVIAKANVVKINSRIRAGLVDKTDGIRPAALE